ncbi:MAG TPA: hypothetical protein VGN05_03750 [Parvibaculum sp.]|jgi:hypothetical protein
MVNTRGGLLAKYKRIWLTLALPFLWLPMIVGALQAPPSEPDGSELHWPHSTAEWLVLPRSVDGWLQARFGFRETLLDINARLRFALRSPTTDRVVFGRDGWLFLSDDAVFQQSMGLRMRVPLVTQLADVALDLEHELKARGAALVIAVPPNSQSINREAVPDWAQAGAVRTEYDVFAEAVRARGIPFADLRALLRDERTREQVYLRTDTHWNNHGALLSYNAVMRAAGKAAWQVDPARVETGFQAVPGGDLARMLGMDKHVSDRQMVLDLGSYKPAPYTEKVLDDREVMPSYVLASDDPKASGPIVMVIGDSFTRTHFRDLIMLHAKRLIWTHHNQCAFDWGLVETYKPDLVILAPTERYALCAPGRSPKNMPESADKKNLEEQAARNRTVVP